MFKRRLHLATSVALICSITACTTTKVSSEKVAGSEISWEVLEKRPGNPTFKLTAIDQYNVLVSSETCSFDYVRAKSGVMYNNRYETKGVSAGAPILLPLYLGLLAWIPDSTKGWRSLKGICVSTSYDQKLEMSDETETKEFLDTKSKNCISAPATTGSVEVAYGEQSLHIKPSNKGIARLPLRHIAHLENLDKKTTIVWDYDGNRLNTISDSTPEQKQEAVRNYLNKLSDDKLFTMQLNDRSGFYKADSKLMEEIRQELPKHYHLEKMNLPPQRNANQLAKSENQPPEGAAQASRENRLARTENAVAPSDGDRSMDQVPESRNVVASTDAEFAYRLVPNQRSMAFKSGDYVGNIELPTIDYSETPGPAELKTNIMARHVNSLLPSYENEDRNMKVTLKDSAMSVVNKTDHPLTLSKMSLYYNGKYVDNLLERPMELAPGSRQEVELKQVIEKDLGLLAKYGNLNAQQAQRMKINFGLGASYLDPRSRQPATMSKVNTYEVYEMIRNMSETAKLEDHMLSLIDEKSIPSVEMRQMLGSQDASETYDPTQVQTKLALEFDTGKADIRKEYLENLNTVGQLMQKYPKAKGIIEGHTDNVGSEEVNQKLSERRALAVKQYLVRSFGIDPARLQAEGYGWSRPVADNAIAEGRAQNRRISGRIIDFGA